jgi:hypothetical protein
MKRRLIVIFLGCVIAACCCTACDTNQKINKDTVDKIDHFIRNVVSDTLEKDYRSHNMEIRVLVTDLKIDRITKKITEQDNVYFARGRASYIIKGNRNWKDKEGNAIRLGPEQAITHWFSCGVLEDTYTHLLYNDDRNRFAFYADNPMDHDMK